MGRRNRRVNRTETTAVPTFSNVGYAALKFLPLFRRPQQSGDFWRYEKGSYFTKSGHARRSSQGTASEMERKVIKDSFSTEEYAKRTWLGEIDEKAADAAVRPSRTATFDVANQIHLEHEKQFKRFVDTDANFGTVVDLSATPLEQWSDYDNSNPRAFMGTQRLALVPYLPYNLGLALPKLKLGLVPSDIEILLEHPRFLDRYKNTDGNLGLTQLADWMKVGEIVVMEAHENTKDPNDITAMSEPTIAPILDNVAILAYVDDEETWGNITWGKSPYWAIPDTAGFVDFAPSGLPIRIRDYEAAEKGGGGDWREGDAFWGTKVVFEYLAVKIENPTA